MAKTNEVEIKALSRVTNRDTETTYEKGETFFLAKERADILHSLGLVEFTKKTDKPEITKPEEN